MHIGICKLSFHLPQSHSLKDKRQISKSIISKVHNSYNVSIAEISENELLQQLTLGISCVSNSSSHASSTLGKIVKYIATIRMDLELIDYQTEVFPG